MSGLQDEPDATRWALLLWLRYPAAIHEIAAGLLLDSERGRDRRDAWESQLRQVLEVITPAVEAGAAPADVDVYGRLLGGGDWISGACEWPS